MLGCWSLCSRAARRIADGRAAQDEPVTGGAVGHPIKGRLQVGGDADITVFDPERVVDRATFENPAQYSEGIPFVLVSGVWWRGTGSWWRALRRGMGCGVSKSVARALVRAAFTLV